MANSVDPDQIAPKEQSELGLLFAQTSPILSTSTVKQILFDHFIFPSREYKTAAGFCFISKVSFAL